MSALVAILLLLVVNALAPVSAASGGQRVAEEPGVSAYVLAPDGTPVSGGTVVAQSGIGSTTASIDRTGRFRLVPMRGGSHQLLVTVPGLAPYRVDSFLDSESDRRFEPPGRLSLGPLAPGAYVIELHDAGGRRTEPVRIVDRDVYATFR